LLSEQLRTLLLHFDEPGALEVMRRAFALYHIDQVLTEIVQPSLVQIGEAWHRGEISIAAEHFATQFYMQNLLGMISASIPPLHRGKIVAACAPGEMHQIGLLMLVVMLRWRGWDVKYLGPDLSLERLAETLNTLRPRVLLFSATRPQAAEALERLPEVLRQLTEPLPILVVGGQAFAETRLPDSIPAVYLQGKPSEVIAAVEQMMGEIFNN
jgi:methanogenic corrinoid protein MtbC1